MSNINIHLIEITEKDFQDQAKDTGEFITSFHGMTSDPFQVGDVFNYEHINNVPDVGDTIDEGLVVSEKLRETFQKKYESKKRFQGKIIKIHSRSMGAIYDHTVGNGTINIEYLCEVIDRFDS